MTDYACYQFTVQDEEGNVVPGAKVEVLSQTIPGMPMPTLYSTRTGGSPITNPATADSHGFVQFFVTGDFYQIRAYEGPSLSPTWERTWSYVPIGLSQGYDVDDLMRAIPDGTVALPGFAFANDPDSGFYRIGANNIGVSMGGAKVMDWSATLMSVATAAAIVLGSALSSGVSALGVTATQPSSPSNTQNAVNLQITGAGSAAQVNRAINVDYLAGYTGSSQTSAGRFVNANAGTGSTTIPASGASTIVGNVGGLFAATATTTGLNAGVASQASNGDVNAGVIGIAQIAKNSAKNFGVIGSAINTGTSPVHVGVFATLNRTTLPTVSAALIADNGSQTDPIFLARDNGTTVFSVLDGGTVTASKITGSNGASATYSFQLAANGAVTFGRTSTISGTIFGLNSNTASTIPSIGIANSLNLIAADGQSAIMVCQAWGNGAAYPAGGFYSYKANGTAASPTAVGNGDFLLDLQGRGYYTSGGPGGVPGYSQGLVGVIGKATETHTYTACGGKLEFYGAANGSTGGVFMIGQAGVIIGSSGTDPGANNLLVNGVANIAGATATPAGGSNAARILLGTTANFGIYFGSGAPTVSAAAGSIYIRTDNAGANLRLYSNTTGSTTWAAITSA